MANTISIGGMRYDILADTTDFEKGVASSVKTRRKAAKVFRETATAEEKLAKEIDDLNDAVKAGDLSMEGYHRALAKLEKDFEKAAKGADKLDKELDDINEPGRFKKMVGGFADLEAGFNMAAGIVRTGVGAITDEIDEVTALDRYSRSLGVNINNLQAFGMMSQKAGKDADVMFDVLRELDMRGAEAASGTGEAADAIARLGINLEEYAGASATEKFRMLSRVVAGLGTVGEQTMAISELAGGEAEDLLSVFQQGPAIFDENRRAVDDLGLAIDQNLVDSMRRSKQEMNEISARWKGLKREMISEAVDSGDAAFVGDMVEGSFNALRGVRDWARENSFGGSYMRNFPTEARFRLGGDQSKQLEATERQTEAINRQTEIMQEVANNVTPVSGI